MILLAPGLVLGSAGYVLLGGAVFLDWPRPLGWAGIGLILTGAAIVLAWGLWKSDVPAIVVSSGLIGMIAFMLWRNYRRRMKRALKTLGAKSWARLAALVSTMRQRLRPRPVLQPAPSGAR